MTNEEIIAAVRRHFETHPLQGGGLCWLDADIVRESIGTGTVVGDTPESNPDAEIFRLDGAENGHCWLEAGCWIIDPWAFARAGVGPVFIKDSPEALRLYGHSSSWEEIEVEGPLDENEGSTCRLICRRAA